MRVDGDDYSVDPRAIGRVVDVLATPARVVGSCAGQVVADHARDWGRARTITDPEHRATAKLRQDLAARRQQRSTRTHGDRCLAAEEGAGVDGGAVDVDLEVQVACTG